MKRLSTSELDEMQEMLELNEVYPCFVKTKKHLEDILEANRWHKDFTTRFQDDPIEFEFRVDIKKLKITCTYQPDQKEVISIHYPNSFSFNQTIETFIKVNKYYSKTDLRELPIMKDILLLIRQMYFLNKAKAKKRARLRRMTTYQKLRVNYLKNKKAQES